MEHYSRLKPRHFVTRYTLSFNRCRLTLELRFGYLSHERDLVGAGSSEILVLEKVLVVIKRLDCLSGLFAELGLELLQVDLLLLSARINILP